MIKTIIVVSLGLMLGSGAVINNLGARTGGFTYSSNPNFPSNGYPAQQTPQGYPAYQYPQSAQSPQYSQAYQTPQYSQGSSTPPQPQNFQNAQYPSNPQVQSNPTAQANSQRPPTFWPPYIPYDPNQNQDPSAGGSGGQNPNNNQPNPNSDKDKYENHKRKYGKNYPPAEDTFRMAIFLNNMKKIEEHNARPGETYTKGQNKFTSLTDQQFRQTYLTAFAPVPPMSTATSTSTTPSSPYPIVGASPIDWTTSGKVGPIKNQGSCGSCWAFSTVGTTEINYALKKGVGYQSYSEQQVVDCCGARGFPSCMGCNGGWTGSGFNYIASAGLTTTSSYPYVAVQQSCRDASVPKTPFLKTPSYTQTNVPATVLSMLSTGVVSVILDANTWSSYRSGIFNGCSATVNYNHAVILVGVDASGNWKVRNSWGTGWGEAGYIRISVSNNCGITGYGLVPILL